MGKISCNAEKAKTERNDVMKGSVTTDHAFNQYKQSPAFIKHALKKRTELLI